MRIPSCKHLLVTFACWAVSSSLWAAEPTPAAKPAETAPKVEQPAPKDNGPDVSITPIVTYINVHGDREKFREDYWIGDGWTGGVEEFTLDQKLDKTTTLKLFGRGVFEDRDYKLGLEIVRPEVGFIRAGFTQYRKYFDSTGGFYKLFSKQSIDGKDDPGLDIGNIFVDVGITLPNLPKMTLGYERQYKNGSKSMLEWGSVSETLSTPPTLPTGNVSKKIFPATKDIDETVDILKFDVEHDIKNVHLGNEFRYEHYQNSTRRLDGSVDLTTTASKSVTVKENFSHGNFSDVFHMESWFNEKLYWSVGYLFSSLDGDAGLRLNTAPFSAVGDKNWFTRDVDLEQDSHVLNLNIYFEPIKNLSAYAGVQGEKTDTQGDTGATLTEITAGPVVSSPNAMISTDNDKRSIEELVGARFIGIPFTTLYAEGKWVQQDIDLFERELEDGSFDGGSAFQRKTETTVDRQQYTVGFNTAPCAHVTWSGRYRHSVRDNEYDNSSDFKTTGGFFVPNDGYSAFVREQKFTTDEISTKVTVRPHAKVNFSLKYQLVSTEIRNSTDAIPALGIPQGSVQSGNYDASIYSANITVTPITRMYVTGLFSLQDTRTIAHDNGTHTVVTYEGDVYTIMGVTGYAINNDVDIAIDYSYSRADNGRNNGYDNTPKAGFTSADYGLPLGVDNERHAASATLTWKMTKSMVSRLRYGFYQFHENSTGGVDNYSAHLASASCAIKF